MYPHTHTHMPHSSTPSHTVCPIPLQTKAERKLAEQLRQDCAQQAQWVFGLDDKCGSDFMHLPFVVRETSKTAGKWRYRFALQGNIFPNHLLRFSLVLPAIKSGVNFGLSAYVSSLFRMQQLGKLGSTVVRQTDSGPDNDAKETHALHFILVYIGACTHVTT